MSAQLQLFDARENADRWTVRVSRRARRLSVRVYPGGKVEVVAPSGVSAAAVQRFVGMHRQWIDRRVADLSAACESSDTMRPDAIELAAIGRRFCVRYELTESPGVRIRVGETEDLLVLCGAVHDAQTVGQVLREWLMVIAARELRRELQSLAQQGGFQFSRMQIRRQRTRWGSCSATGTISLNACVLFQQPAVMRYLLIHELSHTRHMNHSRRFWSQVEAQEPDYRRLDRALAHGWRSVPGWVFG